eukprot:scaffold20339_cov128-Cylindrotheca_fusiformis.AAC.10
MHSYVPRMLMKVLVPPSTVAKYMNQGTASVLSLNIHRDRIGVAVASHNTLEKLNSIPMERLKVGSEGTEELNRIVREHNVCGFLVAWPVQKDTGKWGAPCGRVLFTLDRIMEQTDDVFTPERPVCLWDSFRSENTRQTVDSMGRCSSFGEASAKTRHVASKEQYNQDQNTTATRIWNDFCKVHLPQVAKRMARSKQHQKNKRDPQSDNLVSDWNSQRSSSKAVA